MERRKVVVGGVQLTLPVAKTDAEQRKGLSVIRSLDADQGMIFENEDDVMTAFWMKNTHVPLDIAFVDSSGEIFQISPLAPEDEVAVRPQRAYRWAVEMPRGWFDKNIKSARCSLSS